MPAHRSQPYQIYVPGLARPHDLPAARFFAYLYAHLTEQTGDRAALVRPFVTVRTVQGRMVLTAPEIVKVRTFAQVLEQAFPKTHAGKAQFPVGLRSELRGLCRLVFPDSRDAADMLFARVLDWLAQRQRRWEITWACRPSASSREFWRERSDEISDDVGAFLPSLELPTQFAHLLRYLFLTWYAPAPVPPKPKINFKPRKPAQ